MSTIKIQAIANSNFDKIEYGHAEIRRFSRTEILQKSLKQLVLFWGLAVISVLLPVVHFVLVPLFFVMGAYLALQARKQKQEIISGTVNCPQCQQPVTINKSAFLEEHTEICQHCASVVKISAVI
nr:hypothetical protein BdHM001_20620 [Bdellovibrio sp. HM001]